MWKIILEIKKEKNKKYLNYYGSFEILQMDNGRMEKTKRFNSFVVFILVPLNNENVKTKT